MQPKQQKISWWKTRKGLTICAYCAFALAAGFIILGLTGQSTSFGSGVIFIVLGGIWLTRAKKMPQ